MILMAPRTIPAVALPLLSLSDAATAVTLGPFDADADGLAGEVVLAASCRVGAG
jgi:hypothetical protein